MKRWPTIHRVDVAIDFGNGPEPLGIAVGEGPAIAFQYHEAFVARGLQASPIKLKLGPGPRTGRASWTDSPGCSSTR